MTAEETAFLDCLSDDPRNPSEMTIVFRGDLVWNESTVTVVPGEVVYLYRVDDQVIFAGWPCVTVH